MLGTSAAEGLSVLATVAALVAIAGVAGVGLQMAVAVHRARHPGAPTNRVTLVTTAVSAGAVVVAAPLMMTALRLSLTVVALVAGTTVAVVLAARWLGELQGSSASSASRGRWAWSPPGGTAA